MSTTEIDHHKALDDIISNEDRTATNKLYNNWSETYEEAMATVRYTGPKKLLEYFDKLNVAKDGKILDFCAGTGAMGRELAKMGYTNIHAIDGAENMMAKAKEEGHYKSYTHLLFEPGSKLPFEDSEFDCVLLSGVFAPGHLPIVALHEACRVTKVGGSVAWIQCDPKYYEDKDKQYTDGGFYKVLDEIKNKGLWKEHEGFPVSVPYIEYSDGFVMAFDVVGK